MGVTVNHTDWTGTLQQDLLIVPSGSPVLLVLVVVTFALQLGLVLGLVYSCCRRERSRQELHSTDEQQKVRFTQQDARWSSADSDGADSQWHSVAAYQHPWDLVQG